MNITIYVKTGFGKKKCEDTAVLNETLFDSYLTSVEIENIECIGIGDGVGGNAGGRIASRYIAHEIGKFDFKNMEENEIKHVVNKINNNLINYASMLACQEEMATTFTGLIAGKNGYYLIHAGNTRMYIMQGSYLKQLTNDHTTHTYLMKCGYHEAAERCNKSEINCCFGGGNPDYANRLKIKKIFDSDLPNTFIFTSDGIHDFVDISDIEDLLDQSKSDEEASQKIIKKATQNGSKDDKTIIIARTE